MPPRSLRYTDSGVDVERGDRFVDRLAPFARATPRPGVLAGVGGFAGLFALNGRFRDPVLVAGTGGVGTKLKLAFATQRHATIGRDLVAMCVNDVLCTGAEPLFFLDYFATGRIEPETALAVVRGIADGCMGVELDPAVGVLGVPRRHRNHAVEPRSSAAGSRPRRPPSLESRH